MNKCIQAFAELHFLSEALNEIMDDYNPVASDTCEFLIKEVETFCEHSEAELLGGEFWHLMEGIGFEYQSQSGCVVS